MKIGKSQSSFTWKSVEGDCNVYALFAVNMEIIRMVYRINFAVRDTVSALGGNAKMIPQIYKGDPRTCAIFIPPWGSNWGSLGFSHNLNNSGLSGAYVTCIFCSMSVKINMRKTPQGTRRARTHLFCVCFCTWWSAKPWRPQFEPHGWRRYYTG